MELTVIVWCLLGGVLAGTLAGLLGIGGGLVIVPLLVYLAPELGIEPALVMPTAIATSLATICMTTASSAFSHYRSGLQERFWVVRVLPGLSLGAMVGAFLVTAVDPHWLKMLFSTVLVVLAIRMSLPQSKREVNAKHIKQRWLSVGSTSIGVISGLVGIGGGALTVPFLQRCGLSVRQAIAISSLGSFIIGCSAVLIFIIKGYSSGVAHGALGIIHVPAWLTISIASVICAPVGAKLAHSLPVKQLRRIFAIFLIVVAIKLIFF
ncbi:MAG: sulfite exporter TauE/SafE family protein [Pseudomonadota bacterium]|nr:permease [Idiomarinaceae bacterium]MEC8925084.1 sulfite exporter TauE/SafE family protein [Pseudomonadota bacterium]|tara:strand:- start:399 stop:1193 length:795 start_codon:yes stop_codon:yes gene_type:complete